MGLSNLDCIGIVLKVSFQRIYLVNSRNRGMAEATRDNLGVSRVIYRFLRIEQFMECRCIHGISLDQYPIAKWRYSETSDIANVTCI